MKNDVLKTDQSDVPNNCNYEKYEHVFQEFLYNGIERSKMASMINGVSTNKLKGIGYTCDEQKPKVHALNK